MQNQLTHAIAHHLHLQPDRQGDYHATCPWCGKEPKRGQVHFRFSDAGGYCHVCGQGAGITRLADLILQSDAPRAVRHTPRPKPQKTYHWKAQAVHLVETFRSHPQNLTRWHAYRQTPLEIVHAGRLGFGTLPASRCHHPRLIVPVFDGDLVVGLRGRAVGCDCGKWLAAGGSEYRLYNVESLVERNVAFITENPIDARLLTWRWGVGAVATLGVGIWRDAYTEILKRALTVRVVVAYDNDQPGNGGWLEKWLETHKRPIMPHGVKLVARLRAAGLRAELFDWGNAPYKTDIGDLISIMERGAKI